MLSITLIQIDTLSHIQRYSAPDGKSQIIEITWPSKDDFRRILSEGQIESVSLRMKLKTPVIDFVARVIENGQERKISHTEYIEFKDKIKEYDFAYDEIAHRIYRKGNSSIGIDEFSILAKLLQYIASNYYPCSSAELAYEIYGQDDKKKASLVRQQIQRLRKIHPDIIINVSPSKHYVLNSELKSLFILSN